MADSGQSSVGPSTKYRRLRRLVATATALAGLAAATSLGAGGLVAADAATSTLHLSVIAAQPPHTAFDHYKYLIVRDDAGDPFQAQSDCLPATAPPGTNANYPAGCEWPSVHSVPGGTMAAPSDPNINLSGAPRPEVVTEGDQTTLNATTGPDLPVGKYVVSVQAYDANGNQVAKIDGTHFSVPLNQPGADPGLVTVQANAYDGTNLPLATERIQVFNDTSTNGQWDIPEETNQNMVGFVGHLYDVLEEVTTDWYGNPLCTIYKHSLSPGDPGYNPDPYAGPYVMDPVTGKPVIQTIGGKCLSDASGLIEIGNLGENRYSVQVTPPTSGPQAAYNWVQTTTLEGSHDYDTWQQAGSTGFDGELVRGGEGVPETTFGFVAQGNQLPATGGGEITGNLRASRAYTPPAGGLTFGGESGNALDPPPSDGWISLVSIDAGDTSQYVEPANPDGSFDIKHVPNGDYIVAGWDKNQDYLLQDEQVTVRNNQVTNMRIVEIAHWFSIVRGTVFNDVNGNGKQDPGEPGIPNQDVTLKSRDNSLQDQGTAVSTTDANGHYTFREAYPLGQWVVEEVYNPRYYTTGVTYQADNQPHETTVLGAGVDINTFDLVSLSNRIDWGIRPYAAGTNGGIVGEVVYDATRNELDPRFSATEDYESGISGLTVQLYKPVPDPNDPTGYKHDANGAYTLDPSMLLNEYTTEQWQRPTGCVPRDQNGTAVTFPFLPEYPGPGLPAPDSPRTSGKDCMESFVMGNQVGFWGAQSDQFSLVNGNYGFGTECTDANGVPNYAGNPDACQTTLPKGDYLVHVEVPSDPYNPNHPPLYTPTRQEDINIATGDVYQPQEYPYPCAGPLHTVDVAGSGTDNYPAGTTADGFSYPASTPTVNPGFAAIGGSPSEGEQHPLCDTQLVNLKDQYSATPNFNFFTDVPAPGRFSGLVTDDLTLSTNPNEMYYGEKAGIPNLPIGLYDYSGRLVDTIHTDPNGTFEEILPSTSSYNCPLPAGPCPNVYRFVANDPGTPDHPNALYNPNYRTIATNFQLWPNLTLPADLAPVPIAQLVEGPGSTQLHPANCDLPATTPKIVALETNAGVPETPYRSGSAAHPLTLQGHDFGTTKGSVSLGGVAITPANITSWSDTSITANIPAVTSGNAGHRQLIVTTAAGVSSVNGVTFHMLSGATGSANNPVRFEVSPTVIDATIPAARRFTTIQAALNAARLVPRALVVVYPDTTGPFNPRGAYYENVVINSPVKLQGIGPGGTWKDSTGTTHNVTGSIIDGAYFYTQGGFDATGDNNYATNWNTLVSSLTWVGNQNVYEAADVTVFARTANQFTTGYRASIDGFTLTGGDQITFPGNLNDNGGGPVPNPAGDSQIEAAITQGGGVYVNGYAHFMQITNNMIDGNGGAYGGAIRLGTPNIGSNNNNDMLISHNRILHNGGSNLAGAVAIFNGANRYDISQNDICGNFSAEYGGGISHFGLSPGGSIHDNKIYFNGSYDEGGGVMIAGEMPANPASTLSQGSGSVSVYNNLIQENVANDDGGGLRFLMAGNYPIDVFNNMIVNNVSTHEGGGVALDDTTDVRFYNNTVMKSLTTATAATSNGLPAPAGLSDTKNSTLLQKKINAAGGFESGPQHTALYSDPQMNNNIFWDNRAGRWDITSGTISGIGMAGDPAPINHWDMGVADGTGSLHPHHSLLQVLTPDNCTGCIITSGAVNDGTNTIGSDPNVVMSYDTKIAPFPWRGDPNFINTITISQNIPPTAEGNYHLNTPSPAINTGVTWLSFGISTSPPFDIDNQTRPRPSGGGFDMGADER